MRYAGQRLLAEMATAPFTDRAIESLADALVGTSDNSRTVGQFVGPVVHDRRMLMQLRPGAPQVPWTTDEAGELLARQVPARVAEVVHTPPHQSREVVFGWADPAVNPDRPVKLSYGALDGAPHLAAELREAQAALMARAGLVEGDLLVNSPVGLRDGDYRRALAYMRAGYGPPTRLGDQLARVGPGGQLIPELLTNVDPNLAIRMGWHSE